MLHAEPLRFMTPQEYLLFEKQAEQRHEYVNGLIIAMAGASSPTTETGDRMEKLAAYTAIPGLREYVLIQQDNVSVDLYQNTGDGWEVIRLKHESDTLQLRSIGFSVVLKTLYEDLTDIP